jgi:hypothetical protein
MRVSYLVDGYNLLFQLGLFDRNFGAHALVPVAGSWIT